MDGDGAGSRQPWYLREARRGLDGEPASAAEPPPAAPAPAAWDDVLPIAAPHPASPPADEPPPPPPSRRPVAGDDDLPPWPPGDAPAAPAPPARPRTSARRAARRPSAAAYVALVALGIGGAIGYGVAALVPAPAPRAPPQDIAMPSSRAPLSAIAAPGPLRASSSLCADVDTRDGLRLALFGRARLESPARAPGIERLSEASTLAIADPRLRAADTRGGATLCAGRFVLRLADRATQIGPPLAAAIDYSIQPAVDGRGRIVDLAGAEPLVARIVAAAPRLAAPAETRAEPIVAGGAPLPLPAAGRPSSAATRDVASVAPDTRAPARTADKPARETAAERRAERRVDPGDRHRINCDRPGGRTDRLICGSARLRTLDGAHAALTGGLVTVGDPRAVRKMETSRSRFLYRRDRCRNEACVANLYRDRIESLSDLLRR